MNTINNENYLSFYEGKIIRNEHSNIIQKLEDERITLKLNYIYTLCIDIFSLYQKDQKDIDKSTFQIITQEYVNIVKSYSKILKLRRNDFINEQDIKEKIDSNSNIYIDIFERMLIEKAKKSEYVLKESSNKIKTLIQIEKK